MLTSICMLLCTHLLTYDWLLRHLHRWTSVQILLVKLLSIVLFWEKILFILGFLNVFIVWFYANVNLWHLLLLLFIIYILSHYMYEQFAQAPSSSSLVVLGVWTWNLMINNPTPYPLSHPLMQCKNEFSAALIDE